MTEQIAIELPQERARLLKDFASKQGLSVSEAVDRLVSFLARAKNRSAQSNTLALIGVLNEDPSMWDYLSQKYQ
jgi:hypothetical protein